MAKKKCFLDTTVHQTCPSNCKAALEGNRWISNIKENCIADLKMNEFVNGNNTFTAAVSAFLQAQAEIINDFALRDEGNLELVGYFLQISEPDDLRDVINQISNEILFTVLEKDYQIFLELKKTAGRAAPPNYFSMKSSRFWKSTSQEKLCEMIVFLIHEKHLFNLAGQFLMILSPDVISNFTQYTSLTEDEERELFLALEDNIYTIPLISPKIYQHMLDLFKENFEIFFILETMGALVTRRAEIDEITQSFIRYYKKSGERFSIQWIYSELFGLEYELVMEVLNQLFENQYITQSEKYTLQALLKTGSLDSLSDIKMEILKDS
ncbi:MAG: hypothetical protein H7A24_16760 [Leptospiraceae bacterium]|nr:hypothetical protein [Leptospiraceae bacterium]MCP5513542.1 hypothetical protein [Leptospiraceae bacterium]